MAHENTHRMTGRSARAAWMLAALARRVALAQIEDGQWRASTAPNLAQLPGPYLGTIAAAITTSTTTSTTTTIDDPNCSPSILTTCKN